MDPFYVSTPVQTGQVALSGTPGLSIYYELRGIEHGEKVLLIMGAFATLRTFDELAVSYSYCSPGLVCMMCDRVRLTPRRVVQDCLAKGYQVLTYDHRGIGKSVNASGRPLETQTAEMLAQDALALVNAVWGEAERFHIYGASMGGSLLRYCRV
jgi:alpha-beta hydrolase superfamily lysophospholipase